MRFGLKKYCTKAIYSVDYGCTKQTHTNMNTPFEMKEGRSGTYLGTVDHKSRTGKLIIETLRREHKRRGNLDGKKYYVKLHGRLGKDNPNAHKYSLANRGWKTYGYGQTIKLEDAAHADLYVYERYSY